MKQTTPKHTPGPWAIEAEQPVNIRSVVARTVAGTAISANTQGPHQSVQDSANARLIAAAPELLEALRRIERTDLSTTGRDWLGNYCRVIIAKATA